MFDIDKQEREVHDPIDTSKRRPIDPNDPYLNRRMLRYQRMHPKIYDVNDMT